MMVGYEKNRVGQQRPTFSFAHIQKVNYISLSLRQWKYSETIRSEYIISVQMPCIQHFECVRQKFGLIEYSQTHEKTHF